MTYLNQLMGDAILGLVGLGIGLVLGSLWMWLKWAGEVNAAESVAKHWFNEYARVRKALFEERAKHARMKIEPTGMPGLRNRDVHSSRN